MDVSPDPAVLAAIEELTGHRFADPFLVTRALTHSSAATGRVNSNERLEFLGDAALGFTVCTHLFAEHPTLLEGELTKIKSTVVSGRTCAELAAELGLEPLLTLAFSKSGSLGDEGSKNSGIDQRCSLLCAAAGRGWMRTSALGLT